MLYFWFVRICLVYPMLPVSLGCPFLIAPSLFSNVYSCCSIFNLCVWCFVAHWLSWRIITLWTLYGLSCLDLRFLITRLGCSNFSESFISRVTPAIEKKRIVFYAAWYTYTDNNILRLCVWRPKWSTRPGNEK